MTTSPRCCVLFCFLAVGLTLPPNSTFAQEAGPAAPAPKSPGSLQSRLRQLWSDDPELSAAFRASHHTVAAVPTYRTPPEALAILTPGMKVLVHVAFMVDENGNVAAARVLDSTDVRFNEAAVAAVLKWKFKPAEDNGRRVKSFFLIPITFDGGPPADQLAINLQVGPASYDMRGYGLHMPITIAGPGATYVKAARVAAVRAVDDTGAELKSTGTDSFYHPSVGSISPEDEVRTVLRDLSLSLSKPAPTAASLRSVEAAVELVFPPADPGSTAHVHHISSRLGKPVDSPELLAAGVSLIVFDQALVKAALASDAADLGGVDLSPLSGKPPPGFPPELKRPPVELTDNDLTVTVSDPEGRLVATEFQTSDGQPVHYNHRGWMHAEGLPGHRLSIYRLQSKLDNDIQLVCWLATEKSVQKAPVKIENVPLPPPPGSTKTQPSTGP